VGPVEVRLTVNGEPRACEVEPRTLLVHALRDELGLTGTKIGCDTSQCGACTVLVDGKALKSCTLLAVRLDGSSVTTVEGLADDGRLHALQRAFAEHHGLQCGYCTAGMLMTAADLLARDPDPAPEAIRHALAGNLCRCTGYEPIVESVRAASSELRAPSGFPPRSSTSGRGRSRTRSPRSPTRMRRRSRAGPRCSR
jgi:carbon-monoxide dehydrogenase small subunit